jgi:phosphoribosylaminoimidazolecarboxamide formyltransferase/IMP cyclohydrolase
MHAIQRALISVSDKSGIIELCRGLAAAGVEIISTGGTAKHLREAGLEVREIADITGSPEMMDGRLKTLHPRIHGGLLGRPGMDEPAMASHGIPRIDLLVVNLYPFEAVTADPGCSLSAAIENIDIGGPAMIRAGAKNHDRVTVVVDPQDYPTIAEAIRTQGGLTAQRRFQLAAKAFAHTARYDGAVAAYLSSHACADGDSPFPPVLTRQWRKQTDMRYGENPHQKAAFYHEPSVTGPCIAAARQLQGKPLSFNNIADADAALRCVQGFAEPACVIVKHANPCGAAVADDLEQAYQLAFDTDPTSAFGGIIAVNRPLDGATARRIVDRQFVEVIVAPGVDEQARNILSAKPNVRLLTVDPGNRHQQATQPPWELRSVGGGLLIQEEDCRQITASDLRVVTRREPDPKEMTDLLFAWQVCRFVKSNAIVYAATRRTIGIGAGQMSRVYSARIGAIKAADANLPVAGSVIASDAFFPFRDGVDAAAQAGVTAIIQPGGSRRDQEVIDAANEHGLAMVLTGVRHFRH